MPPLSQPPLWAIWLNIAWFSGLILSLSAAVIGLTVKQWIHEHCSGLHGTGREVARLRQHRLNNLEKWRVAFFVEALTVLLQLALFLFLGGILILLWALHPAVASVASALVTVLFLFTATTTILPSIRDDCCYLSPQSLSVYQMAERLRDRKSVV